MMPHAVFRRLAVVSQPIEGTWRTCVIRSPAVTASATPTREDAWRLLCDWTKSDALRNHGLAVEAVVAWYGEHRFGIAEPEIELWRLAGLLHDFDYERHPDTHPLDGAAELRRLGYPTAVVDAVLGHGDHTGVPRTSLLARTVYAADEMSGFVIAVAYVRPNRSLDEVDARAVRKKMRDKGFARQVDREQLDKGAAELDVSFDEHVANVVEGLKTVRQTLGL
jgi:predicted hydrolase (HD superfamily)